MQIDDIDLEIAPQHAVHDDTLISGLACTVSIVSATSAFQVVLITTIILL